MGAITVKTAVYPLQNYSLGLLALALLLQEGLIFYMITRCNGTCYQGRLLFPAIGPIMLLIAVGFYGLIRAPWRLRLMAIVTLFFLIMSIWMPVNIINPAYEINVEPSWRAWLAPETINANFGNQFILRSFMQESDETSIHLQLYWQAITEPDFDYSTFVHLVDTSGQLVAQADNGLGQAIGFLPTDWRSGDMVQESYELTLPPVRYPVITN
jgi:hypothetical protein